jgi:2-dehydro-3-deoxy-D-arabinonate dehydratase
LAPRLGATARVITTAAAIMVVVFASFVLSTDPTVKMLAIGMAFAVLIDASLVRLGPRKVARVDIIRYRTSESAATLVGVRDEGQVFGLPGVPSLAALWALPLAEIRQRVRDRQPVPAADITLLPPVDGRTEVWAAGVTYFTSREARVEESERSADVYRQVYEAERPELFFKSAAWRVAGDGQTIAARADSVVDVPEPEVALVINRFGEIAGYTACNDVSSRSIEGENPLYLPQAKVYLGGCAVGPAIRPSWEITDPYDLGIELTIRREGAVAWHGQASTASLRRKFDDLVGYLMRADIYPDGVVLATGTCLVPPAPFSLADGDVVTVAVAGVGTLTTVVVRGLDRMLEAFAGA